MRERLTSFYLRTETFRYAHHAARLTKQCAVLRAQGIQVQQAAQHRPQQAVPLTAQTQQPVVPLEQQRRLPFAPAIEQSPLPKKECTQEPRKEQRNASVVYKAANTRRLQP